MVLNNLSWLDDLHDLIVSCGFVPQLVSLLSSQRTEVNARRVSSCVTDLTKTRRGYHEAQKQIFALKTDATRHTEFALHLHRALTLGKTHN